MHARITYENSQPFLLQVLMHPVYMLWRGRMEDHSEDDCYGLAQSVLYPDVSSLGAHVLAKSGMRNAEADPPRSSRRCCIRGKTGDHRDPQNKSWLPWPLHADLPRDAHNRVKPLRCVIPTCSCITDSRRISRSAPSPLSPLSCENRWPGPGTRNPPSRERVLGILGRCSVDLILVSKSGTSPFGHKRTAVGE